MYSKLFDPINIFISLGFKNFYVFVLGSVVLFRNLITG